MGLLQIGSLNTGALVYILLDLLILAVAAYFVIQLLNSSKGWRYLLILLGIFAVLVISSLFVLPGLHLFAQGLAVVLVVALPILFTDEWRQLLQARSVTEVGTSQPKAIGQPAVIALSILFSLLLVGISTGVTSRTGTFPEGIKISAVGVPEGLSASFGSIQTAEVVISAPREKWRSLTADSFAASVNLSNQGEGTYDLPIQVTSKVGGVTIVKTIPAKLVVTVEPVIKKTVAVVASFSGKAGNDLVPDQPEITPDKVDITGPKSVITDVSEVIAAIKLTGQTADIDQKVDLVAQTPSGETISTIKVEPAQAQVKVPLVKSGKLKTVGIQATITGQPKSGFWVQAVSVNPPVISVTGSAAALDALTQVTTAPFSVDGLSSSKEQSLTLSLPSGITVAGATQAVTVSVTIAQTSTTKSITPQLVYGNLSESLAVTATNPTSLSAIVSGASPTLGGLTESDVKATINLAPYKSAGTYTVTIANADFSLPNGITLVSFLPSAISVTLSNK